MALTVSISKNELARVANLAYEGETLEVMLCSVGATGYDEENTAAQWATVEKSGNGYVRYTEVVSTGAYDSGSGRHEIPVISAAFTATGAGYSFDRVVLFITGVSTVHSILIESPAVTLLAGQTITYSLQLATDN